MPLLDRSTLAQLMDRPDLVTEGYEPGADETGFDAYITSICDAVEDEIAGYLQWSPALAVHTAEEGPVAYISTGPYAGRYLIETYHRPLVPGPASTIFTSLQLSYPLALAVPTDVSLAFVSVLHQSGRLYAMAPGAALALAQLTYGWAPALVPGSATGYIATYAAGYATGINDPTPDGTSNTSYNAAPLPSDIRQAAALLARERLMMDAAGNAQTQNPYAGAYQSLRLGTDWQMQFQRPMAGAQPPIIGYGTPLAAAAQNKLAKYRRTPSVALA